jgi:hypothetical protein
MAKAGRIEFDDPIPIDDDEDQETLTAINEVRERRCWPYRAKRRSPQALAPVDYRLLFTPRRSSQALKP